jgi:hypothetical protein
MKMFHSEKWEFKKYFFLSAVKQFNIKKIRDLSEYQRLVKKHKSIYNHHLKLL